MSVAFRDMLAGDAVQLALQPSQHVELGIEMAQIDMPAARDLVAYGRAWTAYDGARILACAGFRETFPGVQAVAWAMLSGELGAAHVAITRYARARVADAPYRRLEAIVSAENDAAVRWARMVGLAPVHLLQCFGAASEPHFLCERIRHG